MPTITSPSSYAAPIAGGSGPDDDTNLTVDTITFSGAGPLAMGIAQITFAGGRIDMGNTGNIVNANNIAAANFTDGHLYTKGLSIRTGYGSAGLENVAGNLDLGGAVTNGNIINCGTITAAGATITTLTGNVTGTASACSKTITTTAPITIDGGTSANLTANRTLAMPAATDSVAGYLTAADHSAFNAKAPLASPTFTGTLTAATITASSLTSSGISSSSISGGSFSGSSVSVSGACTAGSFSGSGAGLSSIPESSVSNLVTDLAAKAPLASPTFTGTVTTAAIKTGGLRVKFTQITGANYTVLSTDDYVAVNTSSSTRTISLPAANSAGFDGKVVWIMKSSASGSDQVTVSSTSTIVSLSGSVTSTFGSQWTGAMFVADPTNNVWIQRS